jgi:uncharacterized protein (UPF0264 family)
MKNERKNVTVINAIKKKVKNLHQAVLRSKKNNVSVINAINPINVRKMRESANALVAKVLTNVVKTIHVKKMVKPL